MIARDRLVDGVAGVVLVMIAGLAYEPVFGGWSYMGRFAVAAVVGGLLAVVFTVDRIPRWLSVVALVVGGFLTAAFVAVPDTLNGVLPTGDTVDAVREGLIDGWAAGLDEFLPLDESNPIMVLLVTLVYAAAVTTTVLTVRTDRVVPPVLPSVAVFAVSLPLAVPAGTAGVATVVAYTAAALGMVLLRANPRGQARMHRADDDFQPDRPWVVVVLVGVPMVLAASVIGVLAASALGLGRTDDPHDPRERRGEEVTDRGVVHPLFDYPSIVEQEPPAPAFQLTTPGGDPTAVTRLRLTALHEYDGTSWLDTSRYERVGTELPSDEDTAERGLPVTVALDLAEVPGPNLPVPGTARELVDVTDARFDPDTGNVLAAAERSDLVVVADVVAEGLDDVGSASAADPEEWADLRAVPAELSPAVATLATQVVVDAQTPQQELVAIRDYIVENTRFAGDASSGHSIGQIERFVEQEVTGGPVQAATLYALMARTLGHPTRVMIGYEVSEEALGAESVEVTSADYSVWPEVRLGDGYGWMPVEVVPAEIPGEGAAESAPGTTVPTVELGGARPTPQQAAPSEGVPLEPAESDSISPVLLLVAGAVFLLAFGVALAVLIVAAKRRRRARRRRAVSPHQRIDGAWADSKDRLLESGVSLAPAMTLSEVVEHSGAQLDEVPMDALAEMVPTVSAAAYADDPPTPESAEAAWVLADTFRRDLRKGRSRVRSTVADLDPRPLIGRR